MGRVAVDSCSGRAAGVLQISSLAEGDDESTTGVETAPRGTRRRVAIGESAIERGVGGGQRGPLLRSQRLAGRRAR